MKIVFFGTSDFGLPSLEALNKPPHKILAVVSTPDKAQGRHLILQGSPIKKWALSKNVPFLESTLLETQESADFLKKLDADIFVVISFGKILKKNIIETPKYMTLNVHASLLPKYRGAAPIHWALLNRDEFTGVSVMRMVEKLDAGDVLLSTKTEISLGEDILSLHERLAFLGRDTLLLSLSYLEQNKAVFTPQLESESSYARKIKKEDGYLRWNQSVPCILSHVRALKEWPTSYTFLNKKRLIITEALPYLGGGLGKEASPGTILRASVEEGLLVAALDGIIEIVSIKAEGKRELKSKEFLKSGWIREGQAFE